jgi:PAS domain S-box-containing protein
MMVLVLAMFGAGCCGWLWWRRREARLWRMRQALEERVRLLLDQCPDAVLLVDAQWRILQANARATEMHGYVADELCRLTLRDLRPSELRPAFDLLVRAASESRELAAETVHCRQDGARFPMSCTLRPTAVDGLPGFQVFIRDLSDLRRLEAERRRIDRLHLVLGQVNRVIEGSGEAVETLGRVCRAVAEYGRFPRVWVGWFEPRSDQGRLVPTAAAGDDTPLAPELAWLAGIGSTGGSPSAALRAGQAWVANDLLVEPGLAAVTDQLEPRCLRSAVFLPLWRGKQVQGCLAIYAAEPGFFDQTVVGLLQAAAQVISLATECSALKAGPPAG